MPRLRPNPDVMLSHPSWYIIPSDFKDSSEHGGTQQGRITCKKGAHQTDPPPIEACRTSRWKGGVLVDIDLSQIELRVAALLSGEPFYVNAYQHGHDLHSRAAAMIWGEPALIARYPDLAHHPIDRWGDINKTFKKRERQVGKRINFAHLFRSGADTMQGSALEDIGELFPISIFERIARARMHELPVLWAWQEARIAEARETGCVTLPITGQSRSFLGGDKYDVNEIVNFPIQTTAGNTLLRICTYILRRPIPGVVCYLNVYDALKFDCASPSHGRSLFALINEAVKWVATRDYWHRLQLLYSREIPLAFDAKSTTPLEP